MPPPTKQPTHNMHSKVPPPKSHHYKNSQNHHHYSNSSQNRGVRLQMPDQYLPKPSFSSTLSPTSRRRGLGQDPHLTRSNTPNMGLNGCGNFLKYSMFLFNAVILIAGCGLLGLGIYSRTSPTGLAKVSAILGSYLYSTLSLALIICGGVVIVVSFLGCCGAIKEVRCMLVTFFILLSVMFVGLIVGTILVYAFREKIEKHSLNELYRSLNDSYGVPGQEQVTNAWNVMQNLLNCCGVEGDINSTTSWAYYKKYSDWYGNQTDVKRYVPDSCCKSEESDHLKKCVGLQNPLLAPVFGPPVPIAQENDQLYTEGCYTAFFSFLGSNVQILIGIGVGVAIMMVLGMIFSICLCRRIKDDYYFD